MCKSIIIIRSLQLSLNMFFVLADISLLASNPCIKINLSKYITFDHSFVLVLEKFVYFRINHLIYMCTVFILVFM